ncbi:MULTISPECIES: potassium channel family protein [Sphingobacterium]|uniref:TrkA family potassium uptake protein n=1 Tax=Sphingobacterium litopenaei TaxID=2763500 RepID=A0ABR7YC05_9SPHI|nr:MULTISPECIES: TrkA family potassium uptake protein [Sphingobacterium]MBD1428824.1 TrkA family potassium uptake protein [Sphingobacterium litopenaei]NGM72526.1 TrkA family potassium uptake protein [Sphingobacterium sp. SGL-16]
MKFIIIGLGNFGASLAMKLTMQGNEVVGVDQRMEKITALKEKITHCICLDATDEAAFYTLPLRNTDVVVVAIGEDEGANIMVTALCKEAGVKRLISRAVNRLHEKVLTALGISEIAHPEEESAERWSKKLCMTGLVDSFELNSNYSIVEAVVPDKYVGKSIQEIGFREKYELLVLTILKSKEQKTTFGKSMVTTILHGIPKPDTVLEQGDILAIYGYNDHIKSFL